MSAILTIGFGLLAATPGLAAPLFTAASSFPVNPEWREHAPAITFPRSLRCELEMSYVSPREPSLSSRSSQRVLWKALPAEKGRDRFELTYEDYTGQTSVRVMTGMDPINTRQDFGIYLAGKTLKLSGTRGQPEKVENLEAVRGQLTAEVKDPVARQALLLTFREDLLLDAARSYLPENGCLRGFGRKSVGSSWKTEIIAQATTMTFGCKFAGWADAAGRRVAVIEVKLPKTRGESRLPTGGAALVETEGSGTLYYDPKSGEGMTILDVDVNQPGSPAAKLRTATHSLPL